MFSLFPLIVANSRTILQNFVFFVLKESRHSLITFIFSSFTGRAMLSERWKNEDSSQEKTLELKNFTWILQR